MEVSIQNLVDPRGAMHSVPTGRSRRNRCRWVSNAGASWTVIATVERLRRMVEKDLAARRYAEEAALLAGPSGQIPTSPVGRLLVAVQELLT